MGKGRARHRWSDVSLGKAEPNDRLCNFISTVKGTTPVGQYSPQGDSPYGCVDMAGNVWDWCADWFDGVTTSVHRRATRLVRLMGNFTYSGAGLGTMERPTCEHLFATGSTLTTGSTSSVFDVPANWSALTGCWVSDQVFTRLRDGFLRVERMESKTLALVLWKQQQDAESYGKIKKRQGVV